MYTEQDYADISAQLKKRLILSIVPAVVMLAAVIVSFIIRIEVLTMLLTAALGVYCIFMYGMIISPVWAYQRHLHNVLHGRVRTLTGAFKEMDEVVAIRDGVRFYSMLINVGKMENPEDDRLFYYDANLPRPEWEVGEMLTLTYHDKAVGAWEKA